MSSPDPIATTTPAEGGKRRRIFGVLFAVFAAIGIAWALWAHFVLAVRERTDDAYVAGNQVNVSAQISGTVVAVLAENTTLVDAGQVLVKLDPTDAASALSAASSALASAVRQVRQQTAQASQYDASIAARRLELARAEADVASRAPLVAEQAIAGEELRHAREQVDIARAALRVAQEQARAAHALVDETAVELNPEVLRARAAYRDAWIDSRRNAIVSPVRGYVAQRSVQLGQHIQAGQALMTVIPLHELWVDANFKENQLRNVRIGQPVTIETDLYGGGVEFHGRVVGMAAGTGAAFSLLPAQNASGNWIKVVQRVPVRVSLDAAELTQHPLRIGLSTTATVDTHERGGAVLASAPATTAGATTDVYGREVEQAEAEADAIIRRNVAGTGASPSRR